MFHEWQCFSKLKLQKRLKVVTAFTLLESRSLIDAHACVVHLTTLPPVSQRLKPRKSLNVAKHSSTTQVGKPLKSSHP